MLKKVHLSQKQLEHLGSNFYEDSGVVLIENISVSKYENRNPIFFICVYESISVINDNCEQVFEKLIWVLPEWIETLTFIQQEKEME